MRESAVLIGLAAGLLVVGWAFVAGVSFERRRAERARQRRGVERAHRQWQLISWYSDEAKVAAFERAARAATMWPHRVDRRADLARHLLSLATVRDLGALAADVDDAPELPDAATPEPPRSADLHVMGGCL